MAEAIIFDDIIPEETPVEIPDEKGVRQRYVLREGDGSVSSRFANYTAKGLRRKPDGTLYTEGLGDAEAFLLSMCLYHAGPDGKVRLKDGKPDPGYLVPMVTIKGWPARVQDRLFREAQRLCRLNTAQPAERKQLAAALSRPDAPVPLAALQEYVGGLNGECGELKEWLKPTPEEEAKNTPAATTGASA